MAVPFWQCLEARPLQQAQKTRQGCGCFRDLFRGSHGEFQEGRRENCGNGSPKSRKASNSRISGTRKGKPLNLGSTLP